MQAIIKPGELHGDISAVPSKSDAHRLLIAAALADGPTRIAMNGSSKDIDATADCLCAMGAKIVPEPDGLTVYPLDRDTASPVLDCSESGTTLRLLLPVTAALFQNVRIIGRGRLPDRPLKELIGCLRANGAEFDSESLPLTLLGSLQAGEYCIPGNVSSQYISGLLFALPLLNKESYIQLTSPLESAGYVDMTLSVLGRFGIQIHKQEDGFFIPGGQRYRSPGSLRVEGDWSNAAFFLAAGALSQSVLVTGLGPSMQPDQTIHKLLSRFGAIVEQRGDGVLVMPAPLHGIDIDVSQSPDLVPILAVIGALSMGQTRLYNARRLRMKESDRLFSVTAMLRALGAQVQELPDELVIAGSRLSGGTVDCCGDHRIAMAAAIAATVADGETTLTGAQCVEKSYPTFFEDFMTLGGNVHVF